MMYDNRRESDLLMDAPQTDSCQELQLEVTEENDKVCQKLVFTIKTLCMQT